MPWKESTTMSMRKEFIQQANKDGVNISHLCREFGISRKTGYKWLKRDSLEGNKELEDLSRRPHSSPRKTIPEIEELILNVRQEHKTWGARKILKVLENAGYKGLPAASTVTAILKRNQWIDPHETEKHKAFQRFEREKPNELWQMDFKGYFATAKGGYCHPLTIIDDCSRFLVGLQACPNELASTVQAQLTTIFQRFGLPDCILMDNGSPWGDDRETPYTILGAWLLRLDIAISHGRPYHPQTQGKDERLNRTLKEEVIQQHNMVDLQESQMFFDDWWYTYNYIRPHEALSMDTPATHYQPSSRPFPKILPPVIYDEGEIIRKVDQMGRISYANHSIKVGKAFRYQPVTLRPVDQDGQFNIYYCKQKIAQFDLKKDNLK